MHDLFYSEEQYREAQDDLGDGYTNEYQRCYAQSCMEQPLKDERAEAKRLHEAGRWVVCAEWDVCCPVTDGLIGYDWIVVKDFATREEAEAFIGVDPEDRAEGVFLYKPIQPRFTDDPETGVWRKDEDDQVPF